MEFLKNSKKFLQSFADPPYNFWIVAQQFDILTMSFNSVFWCGMRITWACRAKVWRLLRRRFHIFWHCHSKRRFCHSYFDSERRWRRQLLLPMVGLLLPTDTRRLRIWNKVRWREFSRHQWCNCSWQWWFASAYKRFWYISSQWHNVSPHCNLLWRKIWWFSNGVQIQEASGLRLEHRVRFNLFDNYLE